MLGRARRRVVVVDAGVPRNAPAAHMQGFLSRDGMPPKELLAAGRAEVEGYGVRVVDDRVTSVEPGFTVRLASGDVLAARRILVTTGVGDEIPDLPGVRERWGPTFLSAGPRPVALPVLPRMGGPRSAARRARLPSGVGAARELVRQWSDDVVFFSPTPDVAEADREALDARGISVVEGAVARLVVEDDRLTGVELVDGRVIPRTAVFVRPGTFPTRTACWRPSGAASTTPASWSSIAPARTSTPGVWAAGNVVDPRAQVITAAGQGSAAAIDLNADLVREDIECAVRTEAGGSGGRDAGI